MPPTHFRPKPTGLGFDNLVLICKGPFRFFTHNFVLWTHYLCWWVGIDLCPVSERPHFGLRRGLGGTRSALVDQNLWKKLQLQTPLSQLSVFPTKLLVFYAQKLELQSIFVRKSKDFARTFASKSLKTKSQFGSGQKSVISVQVVVVHSSFVHWSSR